MNLIKLCAFFPSEFLSEEAREQLQRGRSESAALEQELAVVQATRDEMASKLKLLRDQVVEHRANIRAASAELGLGEQHEVMDVDDVSEPFYGAAQVPQPRERLDDPNNEAGPSGSGNVPRPSDSANTSGPSGSGEAEPDSNEAMDLTAAGDAALSPSQLNDQLCDTPVSFLTY